MCWIRQAHIFYRRLAHRRRLKCQLISSGQAYSYIFWPDTLLEAQELRPPRRREGIQSFARSRADRKKPECFGRVDGRRVLLAQEIHLRENHAMRLGREVRRVLADLTPQLVVLRLPVHRVDRDQERQDPGSLDVPEELEAQALPLVRSFDDPRNVRDHERPVVGQLDHTEVGLEGREGVVGDLWASGGDNREERGLARVRLTDESHVGDQLELHLDRVDYALFARLPFSRRLVGGRRKKRVPLP